MKSKLKKSLSLLLALVMCLSCMSMSAFAGSVKIDDDSDTIGDADVINVTAATAQDVLYGKYGNINGKTIHFTESISEVLELNCATAYKDSGTLYYKGAWENTGNTWDTDPTPWSADIASQLTWRPKYERTLENVTFTADSGVTLAGFKAAYSGLASGEAYDYVRNVESANSENAFFMVSHLKNVVFSGLTITGQIDLSHSYGGQSATVDGITIAGCTFIGDTAKMETDTFQAVRMLGNSDAYNKNVTVSNCTITNYYQGVYVQFAQNLVVKNCHISGTKHNAINAQGGTAGNGVSVTIQENYITGAKDRAIRFDDSLVAGTFTVTNNVIVGSGDDSNQNLKGTVAADSKATFDLEHNYWNGKTAAEAVNGPTAPTNVGVIDGTFPVDVSDYCAVGYTAVNNGNDTWTVQASEHFYYRSADNAWHIADLEGLEMFRNSVNNGNSFKGQTVYLDAESITLSGSWTPIGNSKRITAQSVQGKDTVLTGAPYFAGTFNGQGHEIKGLTNGEYTPADTSLDADHNYVYGLFGTVGNGAVIENLNLTGVVIDTTGTENVKGDSVGALAGYSFGNVKIDKVSVSGSVKGLDAVGAIIGRVYQGKFNDTKTIELTNCSSDATVSGIEQNEIGSKVSGLFGYVTSHNKAGGTIYPVKVIMTGNRFTGDVSTGIYTSPIAVLGKLVFSDVDNFTPANDGTISGNTVNGGAATMELSGTVNYGGRNATNEMVLLKAPKVAEVNGVQYETFAEAWSAANDADASILKLLADVSLAEQYEATGNFTLNLNNHNINTTHRLRLVNGTLNIDGTGTITTTNSGMAPVDVRYDKTNDATARRTLTIGSGVTLNGTCYGLNIFGTNEGTVANNIDVTVNGTIKGMLFVLGNLTNTANQINITVNGTVDASKATGEEAVHTGIAGNGYANITVGSNAVVKGESGIEVRAGSLTVNGGVITATANAYSYEANGSGTTTKGAAIAVAQHNTKLPTSATINGGTLTGGVYKIGVTDVNSNMSGITVTAASALTGSTVIPEGYEWADATAASYKTLTKAEETFADQTTAEIEAALTSPSTSNEKITVTTVGTGDDAVQVATITPADTTDTKTYIAYKASNSDELKTVSYSTSAEGASTTAVTATATTPALGASTAPVSKENVKFTDFAVENNASGNVTYAVGMHIENTKNTSVSVAYDVYPTISINGATATKLDNKYFTSTTDLVLAVPAEWKTITSVTHNNVEMPSGEWSFNSATHTVTVTASSFSVYGVSGTTAESSTGENTLTNEDKDDANFAYKAYLNLQDQFYYTLQFHVSDALAAQDWYITYEYEGSETKTVTKNQFVNNAFDSVKMKSTLAAGDLYACDVRDGDTIYDGFYEIRRAIYPTDMGKTITITLWDGVGNAVPLYSITGSYGADKYDFTKMNSAGTYQSTMYRYLTKLANKSAWTDTANALIAFGQACEKQNWSAS